MPCLCTLHLSCRCCCCCSSFGQSAAWPGNFSALSSNEYLDQLPKFKTPRVLEARARSSRCFDFDYYMKENPDLKHIWGNITLLWRHFVYYGQFDARPHK